MWVTSLWMSTALVVASTALHISLDQNPLTINEDITTQGTKLTDTMQTSTPDKQNLQPDKIKAISTGNEREELGNKVSDLSSQQNQNSQETMENNSRSIEVDDDTTQPPDTIGGNNDTNNNSSVGVVPTQPGEEAEVPESSEDAATIIQTTTGPVKGHMWRDNANIISYIDIKYGVYKSHFAAPASPERWETVHDVKEHSKRCPQLQNNVFVGDTDCLTLSIFKPLNAFRENVLFHIHEGNFAYGSGNPALYGPEYLVSKGVILVLPNYRLGPLGFLCLQNETAEGNAALKDLSLALTWVKDNIDKFGGDPTNIAVSADGTSGALAGYLALSPMSEGYISKVITESGSVLSYWALDRNPTVTATSLTRNINGFQSWSDLTTSALISAANNVLLRPCVEKSTDNGTHFMVETPWAMIGSKKINITFIIGSAMYAGVHEFLKHTASSIQQLNNNVELLLPNDLSFDRNTDRIRTGEMVKNQYFGDSDITIDKVEPLSLYYTDIAYLGPGIRTARPLVDSGATVYFYEFSFVGDLNRELKAINRPVEGAVKGDIVGYVFTQDGVVPALDTKERQMVDQLVDLWTNFLKTGTPSAANIEWKKLEKANDTEEQWLSIANETKLQKGLHVKRLKFWTDIYNQHYIERNSAFCTLPSIYAVVLLQIFLIALLI